jgi:hypothetical protein
VSYPHNPEPDDIFYRQADYDQAAMEAEGRADSRARRRSEQLAAAGDLAAAARACPHGGGYPLASPAARNARDPRAGESGFRCDDCGSVLDLDPFWHPDECAVVHPCETWSARPAGGAA